MGSSRLQIHITRSTVLAILDLSREVAPKEFSAFIEGKVRKDILLLDGLLYQPYVASPDSAWVHVNLPLTSGAKASVHSHPSGSIRPSAADLHFFSKHGAVHFIVGAPFLAGTMACYDKEGHRLDFEIVEDKQE
jgi:proteasome lid subunit RPN8/RPN11